MTDVQIDDQKAAGVSILDKTVILEIAFGRFRNTATTSLAPVSVNAEKSMLSLSKRLMVSKEFQAIVAHDRETRDYIARMAVPFPVRTGSAAVPIPYVADVENHLRARVESRNALIEAFIAVYPEQVAAVQATLRDVYDPRNYPSVDSLRSKFKLDWRWIDFGVPGRMKSINATLFANAIDKMNQEVAEATVEIQAVMREGMATLVAKLADVLTPGEDGKKKIFRDSSVENLTAFLNSFDVRNVTNDTELAKLVKDARALLVGVEPDQLRKNEGLRAAMAQSFTAMTAQFGTLVTDKTRAIEFGADE